MGHNHPWMRQILHLLYRSLRAGRGKHRCRRNCAPSRRGCCRGFREVTLLGQTVNSYRGEECDFADLLCVAAVDGIERLRFTSPFWPI